MQKFIFSIAVLLTITTSGLGQLVDTTLGPLVENFSIKAVGTYNGQTPVADIELDNSGHEVAQAEVVVNCPDQPVVLVLTAYDPTVWRVGRTEKTEIVGIMISGYHGQALIGAEKLIPLEISTSDRKGKFGYFYAYEAGQKLLNMNKKLKKHFGREIDRFEGSQQIVDGTFYVGKQPDAEEKILYFNEYSVEDYNLRKKVEDPAKKDRPIAGQAALDALVAENKLRPATSVDINAWVTKASAKFKRFNPALRVRTPMGTRRTYVVLEKLELPDGLHGAHSRSFIIPDEVPFPGGPKCHNSFYWMDGSKMGPGGRRSGGEKEL